MATAKGTATRPTGDRVKEAIFSMVGPFFQGGVCLDLFAGSGALGIEAISRGMERAVFVDTASADTVTANVVTLRIEAESTIWRMSYDIALERLAAEGKRFELVFLDPPYKKELVPMCLQTLVQRNLLQPDATVVAEMDKLTATPAVAGLVLLREALYGMTKVCIYRFV